MNECIFAGMLLNKKELKQISQGTSMIRFNVGVKQNYKDKNGNYSMDFLPCSAFGRIAEFINTYFEDGDVIELTCSASMSSWMSNEGKKLTKIEFKVRDASFGARPKKIRDKELGKYFDDELSSKKTKKEEVDISESSFTIVDDDDDDDLPF